MTQKQKDWMGKRCEELDALCKDGKWNDATAFAAQIHAQLRERVFQMANQMDDEIKAMLLEVLVRNQNALKQAQHERTHG
jgi:hypothetical protein